MTTVFNLSTGDVKQYSLPPREAVIAAWEQEKRNYNTWDYGKSKAPLTIGNKTIAAGDWCARLEATPEDEHDKCKTV
jgi:hypothetical protein